MRNILNHRIITNKTAHSLSWESPNRYGHLKSDEKFQNPLLDQYSSNFVSALSLLIKYLLKIFSSTEMVCSI